MEWFLLLENEVSSKWITVNDMVTLYPVNGNSLSITEIPNIFPIRKMIFPLREMNLYIQLHVFIFSFTDLKWSHLWLFYQTILCFMVLPKRGNRRQWWFLGFKENYYLHKQTHIDAPWKLWKKARKHQAKSAMCQYNFNYDVNQSDPTLLML